MTPEQIEEAKKKSFPDMKEKISKMLQGVEGELPKDMKTLTLDMTTPHNPYMAQPRPADMQYDPEKKSLNLPFDRLDKTAEENSKELQDAKNPDLIAQRKKLSDLGIRWSDPNNSLTGAEEIEVMKSLENAASKVSPDKRPKDLPINVLNRSTSINLGGLGGSGSGAMDAEGMYNTRSNHIELSRVDYKGKPHTIEELKDTAVHEYGHAVADTNIPDQKAEGFVKPDIERHITDSQGRNISERAVALEEKTKKAGHNPDDPGEDKTLYDKHDPYVDSHGLVDDKDKVVVEKYARYNENEHYAETFREYVNSPERFRSGIKGMEEELKKQTPGSEEYEYLKESLDIKKESYNYFKTQIFGGHEFGQQN